MGARGMKVWDAQKNAWRGLEVGELVCASTNWTDDGEELRCSLLEGHTGLHRQMQAEGSRRQGRIEGIWLYGKPP